MRARDGLALLFALVTAGSPAFAQSAPGEDSAKVASEHFRRGREAFDRKDFLAAGRAFDAAYGAAPHHDALWNSAQSWESAGEIARAANRYATYLRIAPDTAPGRSTAAASLGALTRKLGRLHVYAAASEQPRVDGESVNADVFYVYPGTHIVTIVRRRGTLDREVSLAAQEDKSVSFAGDQATSLEPEPVPARAEPQALSTPAEVPTRASGTRGLPPWVALVGGGLAVAGAGATTFFGIRSSDTKNDFDRRPSADLLESGRADQARANFALGVTIGIVAITTCVALLFVDWKPTPRSSR